jgi:hypothetical protein
MGPGLRRHDGENVVAAARIVTLTRDLLEADGQFVDGLGDRHLS